MRKVYLFILIVSLLFISNVRGENKKYYSSHIGIKIEKAMNIEKGQSEVRNINYEIWRYPSMISFFYNYLNKKGGMFEMELGYGWKSLSDGYYHWDYDTGSEYTYASYDVKNSVVTFDISGGFKIISTGFKFLFRGTPTFKNNNSGAQIEDEDFSETDVIFYVGVGGLINLDFTDDNKYGLALKVKVGYPLTAGYSELYSTTWSGYYLEIAAGIGYGI